MYPEGITQRKGNMKVVHKKVCFEDPMSQVICCLICKKLSYVNICPYI